MMLGERIKKFRKENTITEKELANVLGITVEFLKQVEANKISIESESILEKLKKIIGDIPEPTLNGKTAEEIVGGIFGTNVDDNVNNPKHYQIEGINIESIDIIKVALDKKLSAFYVGNALKYLIRAEKKNGKEDYRKALKYLDWAQEDADEHGISLRALTSNIGDRLGVDWLDIISGITAGMPFKKALLLHEIFKSLLFGDYNLARNGLVKIIEM